MVYAKNKYMCKANIGVYRWLLNHSQNQSWYTITIKVGVIGALQYGCDCMDRMEWRREDNGESVYHSPSPTAPATPVAGEIVLSLEK